jgi:hypothetical protein
LWKLSWGTELIGANLDNHQKMVGMWVGAGLFLFVNLEVWLLVWCKPENLTNDRTGNLISAGRVPPESVSSVLLEGMPTEPEGQIRNVPKRRSPKKSKVKSGTAWSTSPESPQPTNKGEA